MLVDNLNLEKELTLLLQVSRISITLRAIIIKRKTRTMKLIGTLAQIQELILNSKTSVID